MDIFWFSFNAISPLMLLVALGVFLRRIGLIDDVLNSKANKLLFQIAFPASLFYTISNIEITEYFSPSLFLFAACTILIVIFLLMMIVPVFVKDRRQCGAFIQGVYRGNYLLLGYPLARNLFGEEGIGPTAMLLPVVIAIYNIMAVFILEYYSEKKRDINWVAIFVSIIKNPLIIGAGSGVVFAALPIELPVFINQAVRDTASIANPLALILLGSQVSWHKMTGRFKLVITAAMLRLFILPSVIIGIAVLIGFRGANLGALFILFCAPTAVSSYIMAKNMNSDSDLAAQIIVLTTALSGISLFIITYVLRYLSFI